jgi:transposase
MWKPERRVAADRRGLRYPSDMTDEEWALVAPLIRPAKRGGRPRTVNIREVLNAIFYVLATGCQWQALPKDFPPKSTVWDYLDLWEWDGTIERIHHVLYVAVREQAGRDASPSTAMTARLRRARKRRRYARSVRVSLSSGGLWPDPGDAGKKLVGRKRHILTDTLGFLNAIERAVPADKRIEAVVDNYATHKHPKVRDWLARHPRWTFHFTPTAGSWLNAVETFFSALTRKRASGAAASIPSSTCKPPLNAISPNIMPNRSPSSGLRPPRPSWLNSADSPHRLYESEH